ncbi:uncharacterized protein PGTG_16850 [Puccinia graminis f. sp. tritici CRL 75-36-700-3]|uniref:DUF4219 domain-containing protein n=1 Tax=Puccinia graminis f. sp. tritici (strain CRL 75-36-700-3 / race SCCL) TaxID=418459 RepID=E3L2J1_PUCGT|nr:uncharacterized protein PGTG_16850 [Puccinia graminis f. sp. tritici CRL 75-36-700-3]EFP90824.1 hypothetical protein PGTG_16850 [Puccinia graminis f. sp. tritici CRL 75-36-700-3]
MEEEEVQSVKSESLLPILNADNYSSWYGRMMVHLRGKDLWHVCSKPVASNASDTAIAKHNKAMFEALAIIIPRLSIHCYRECVTSETINDSRLLWDALSDQKALINIDTVDITMPKKISSYFILGKLMNQDLDQVVDKTAFDAEVIVHHPLAHSK